MTLATHHTLCILVCLYTKQQQPTCNLTPDSRSIPTRLLSSFPLSGNMQSAMDLGNGAGFAIPSWVMIIFFLVTMAGFVYFVRVLLMLGSDRKKPRKDKSGKKKKKGRRAA